MLLEVRFIYSEYEMVPTMDDIKNEAVLMETLLAFHLDH